MASADADCFKGFRSGGRRPAPGSWRRLSGLVAAALLLTLLNCVKPLHVDDPTFHRYAAQIAAHPLDPYGFESRWTSLRARRRSRAGRSGSAGVGCTGVTRTGGGNANET